MQLARLDVVDKAAHIVRVRNELGLFDASNALLDIRGQVREGLEGKARLDARGRLDLRL